MGMGVKFSNAAETRQMRLSHLGFRTGDINVAAHLSLFFNNSIDHKTDILISI